MNFFWGESRVGRTPTDPETPLMVIMRSHQKIIITITRYPIGLSYLASYKH